MELSEPQLQRRSPGGVWGLSLLPLGFDVLQHFINMRRECSGLCAVMNCSSNLLSLLPNRCHLSDPEYQLCLGSHRGSGEWGESFRMETGILAVLVKRARSQLL